MNQQQNNNQPVVGKPVTVNSPAVNAGANIPPNNHMNVGESDKDFIGTLILSHFLGFLGVDRFYVGKVLTGILKLVTFGGLGIWAFVDFLLICFGKFKDKDGRVLRGYEHNKSWARILGWGYLAFGILFVLFYAVIIIIAILSDPAQGNDLGITNQ